MSIIVITGGTGLVGRALTRHLRSDGHIVRILSRAEKPGDPFVYRWDPDKRYIDEAALEGADCLVHLAGENTWTKPLTAKRRQEVRDSRIKSLAFLFETIEVGGIPIKTLVSASAIGYYGATTSDIPCMEYEQAFDDFWGSLCLDWENEAMRFQAIGVRTVVLRTALVLSGKGGFLPPLLKLVGLGGATVMGNGRQHLPWIHLDDLCRIYRLAIENETYKGTYNAVSPDDQTNHSFLRHLATHLNRPTLLPPIPSWCIRLFLGKRGVLLLEGRPVSSQKILASGFEFTFPDLDAALRQEIP